MSSFNKTKYKFSLLEPLSLTGEAIVKERGRQCGLMIKELSAHNVLIKDLISECPNDDVRNEILNIAYYILSDLECYEKVIQEKKIPVSEIIKKIEITKSFLELWQEYIIVYVIILGNPSYKYLEDYLRIEESIELSGFKELSVNKSMILIKGIVISKSKKSAIILTSRGEFRKINIKETVDVGDELSGEKFEGLKKYKLYLAIVAILIIIMISTIYIEYSTVKKTIVISTTSLIKVEVNSFNKVINAQSPTPKGEKMLQEIKIQDKDIDESLHKILKYATKNEMIPNGDVLITVSGKKVELEMLKETNKFLEESGIPVKLNNSGNEHYINQ